MGTRADFYVGRGTDAEWLGSIGWDGYPDGIAGEVLGAQTEDEYRAAIAAHISCRDDFTAPGSGWPWPWDDSSTTDYAYAFDDGKVFASCFGREWFQASEEQPDRDGGKTAVFPDMSSRKAVTLGPRSGLMVFTA